MPDSGHFKNPKQVEFADLFMEIKDCGWNAANVARELHIKPGAVSMLLKGSRTPRDQTLEALRTLRNRLVDAKSKGQEIEAQPQVSIHQQIDFLAENDPTGYEVARITVDTLHRRAKEVPSKTKAKKPEVPPRDGRDGSKPNSGN